MRIFWSPASRRKIEEILNYISSYDTGAAADLMREFEKSINSLKNSVSIHSEEPADWIRELIVRAGYLVIYEIRNNRIHILTIRRTRQDAGGPDAET